MAPAPGDSGPGPGQEGIIVATALPLATHLFLIAVPLLIVLSVLVQFWKGRRRER